MMSSFPPTSDDQLTRPARRDRPSRRWRPSGFEGLEGRALMTISPLDPTFHGGQPVLTPTDATGTTGLDTADAVAVQADGKIVVVGRIGVVAGGTGTGLAVQRYNADGSIDTTFGTSGEANIPLPDGSDSAISLSHVLIRSDGKITLAANLYSNSGQTIAGTEPLVVRLDADGTLDPTFGTGGETRPHATYSTDNTTDFGSTILTLAQTSDGRVVLGGQDDFRMAGSTSVFREPTIAVLADNGSLDPSFHGGTPLVLDPGTYSVPGTVYSDYIGTTVTPQGRIVVVYRPSSAFSLQNPNDNYDERIAAFQLDGSPDANFGSGGLLIVPDTDGDFIASAPFTALAASPVDGRLFLATETNGQDRLLAFTATGQPDSTFANPKIDTSFAALAVDTAGRIVLAPGTPLRGNPFGIYDDITVQRFLPNGAVDTTFGPSGRVGYKFTPIPGAAQSQFSLAGINSSGEFGGLAITPGGQVLVAGSYQGFGTNPDPNGSSLIASQAAIVQFRATSALSGANNDYDGDNISDLAAEITALGLFAYRKSTGGDVVQGFGSPGMGQTLPAPGDYDGDGKTDVAAYLPSLGVLAYRPSSGGPDVIVRFGPTGVGNAIPTPGDYDGDGRTDVALYLPSVGAFVVDPSSGAAPYAVQYGAAGAGQTIPVAADYDGDGTTDFAVYLPATGQFFRRLSGDPSTADTGIAFGSPGAGASIPAPGDYQGLGRAQFAVYLPAAGAFAVLDGYPKGFASNFAVSFGAAGLGESIPVPGDYDGDGTGDFAVYLPALGSFAYRPSGGGADVIEGFGTPGAGQTVPAAALPIPAPPTVQAMSLPATAAGADVPVALVGLDLEPTPAKKAARS